MRMTARTSESAFGVVEALIAALLLTVIAAGAMMMLASSGRSLRASDVHRMRTEVARATVQHLSGSQEWGRTVAACRDSSLPGRAPCDVSALVAQQPWLTQRIGARRATFRVSATAQGVDSPVDGTGPADRDRRTPDWFELRVVVEGGGAGSLTLDASTDSATRGTGGLVLVRTCAAPGQADERVEPGTCERSGSITMPPPSGSGPSLDRDLVPYAVAPGWAKQVAIQPISVRCTLQGPGGTHALQTSANGTWLAPTGLEPGTWRVQCATPPGFEPWERRTTPAGGTLTVEEGRTATAFVMYRRPPVSVRLNQGTIHYFRYQVCSSRSCIGPLERSTFERRFERYDTSALQIPIQAIPSPYGRLALAPAATASAGTDLALHPGLYGNTALAGNDQYYVYTGDEDGSALGVDFGAPISWFYVHPDGRVETGPGDDAGSGLWLVRWYCHSGDTPMQMPCPEGRVPQGRGPLALGGAGGRGGG